MIQMQNNKPPLTYMVGGGYFCFPLDTPNYVLSFWHTQQSAGMVHSVFAFLNLLHFPAYAGMALIAFEGMSKVEIPAYAGK